MTDDTDMDNGVAARAPEGGFGVVGIHLDLDVIGIVVRTYPIGGKASLVRPDIARRTGSFRAIAGVNEIDRIDVTVVVLVEGGKVNQGINQRERILDHGLSVRLCALQTVVEPA